jgi:hypothetical protein
MRNVLHSSRDGGPHGQHVVAVDHLSGHAVTRRPVGQVLTGVLLVGWSRQGPLVVLDDEDDG